MTQENKIEVAAGIFYHVPTSTAERPIEILNEHKVKAEQYWRRQTDFPPFFYDYNPHLPDKQVCRINASRTEYRHGKLASLSVEDTIELDRLVKREYDRMRNGVFMMNNGIRIYLPGFYYGLLQHVKLFGVTKNNGYGQHRRCQRELAYVRQLAIQEERLSGYYVHKIKKCGVTAWLQACYVVESIIYKQFTTATMSKNHDTAKKANFKYYLYGLKNLPPVLRPPIEQKGWMSAVQKIEIRSSDPEFSLDNTCCACASVINGLDGLPPLQRVNLDEMPKMANVEDIYTKSKEQLTIQKTKQGIIEMTSYPPEDDSKSFFWCRDFYKEAEKMDEDGWPKNKIIPFYIGVADSTDGTIDIYGEPDKLKALQLEQIERDKCKTPYDLQARKRQYSVTAKEGWESGGGGTVYNNIALGEQEVILEEQYLFNQLNYREGNLEWTAGRMSPVRFSPLTHKEIMDGKTGKWKIYCSEEYLEKHTNLCFKMPRKVKIINREKVMLLQPPDYDFVAAGTDPVDNAFVSEISTKKSMNASTIMDIQGNLLSFYFNRDEDPAVAIDDFIMEMIFFGTRSLVEGNRKDAVTTLEKNGMYFFMLVRHPNGEIVPYGNGMSIKHISSGKDLKSLYIGLTMKAIKNSIEQFKCLQIIKQHKEFDPIHTQEYDASVSDSLCRVALDALQTWVLTKRNKVNQYAEIREAMAAVMGAVA